MSQIFISGLPYTSNEQEIYDLFSECGEIINVKLPKFQDTGRLLGYGHVTFKDGSSIEKALLKDRHQLGGRYIEVKVAQGQQIKKTNEIPPDDCTTIFVKNLPYDLNAEQIGDAFRPCGKIENVRMVYNHQSGNFKGFAYIDFESHLSVKKALQMNGKKVHGRLVQVDFDTKKPKAGFKYSEQQLNEQNKYLDNKEEAYQEGKRKEQNSQNKEFCRNSETDFSIKKQITNMSHSFIVLRFYLSSNLSLILAAPQLTIWSVGFLWMCIYLLITFSIFFSRINGLSDSILSPYASRNSLGDLIDQVSQVEMDLDIVLHR
ncbi:hypothetical protein pb186bvf_005245 [Paramecium bursaria]